MDTIQAKGFVKAAYTASSNLTPDLLIDKLMVVVLTESKAAALSKQRLKLTARICSVFHSHHSLGGWEGGGGV